MVWTDNPERFANTPIFMQTCLSSRRQGSYRFEHTLSQALSSRSADSKLRRQCIQPASDPDESGRSDLSSSGQVAMTCAAMTARAIPSRSDLPFNPEDVRPTGCRVVEGT